MLPSFCSPLRCTYINNAGKGFNSLLFIFLLSGLPLFLSAQTYKILPLGNSITEGKVENPGYRYPLYDKLTDANIDFEFIGSLTANFVWNRDVQSCIEQPGSIPVLAHEGHGGWRADQILNGKSGDDPGKLSVWLQNYTPDVVLMHLGSNDMFQDQSVTGTLIELRDVVRVLRQDNPRVIILMAKLIPAHGPTVGTNKETNVRLFNNEIPRLVQELNTAQSPVILVDQYTGFNAAPGEDTFDGIHANTKGAIKMADKWFQALKEVLNSYTKSPTVSITAPARGTEHTVRQSIKVAAAASDPEGAVKLVEFFANCEKIGEDASSPFEIDWTPAQAGEFKLEARVTDAAGAKAVSQAVTVQVLEKTQTDYTTGQPQLYKPEQNATSSNDIAVEFSLPEAAKAGTVTLSFSRTGGNSDSYAPHVLTFTSAAETAGRHSFTLKGNRLGSGSNVSSVSSGPNDALVSGTTYAVTVSYQDKPGNRAASDTKSDFIYDVTPPAIPEKPSLGGNSDTGISNTDDITANTMPQLNGAAEAGSRVWVYLNESILATTTADANGRWYYVIPAEKELGDGRYLVKAAASDAAGNKSGTGESLTFVVDRQAPRVLVKDFTLALDATGNASVAAADVNNGSSDNFTAASALIFSLSRTNYSCQDLDQRRELTLSVTDQAGNIATGTAKVVVKDLLPPNLKVQDVYLQLDANGKATLTEVAAVVSNSDNCSTPAIGMSRTAFGCADAGKSFTITVTATDAAGNKTEKPLTVHVEDKVAPIARTKNITVSLDASGKAVIKAADVDNGSSDGCSTVSLSLNKSSFSCSDLGTNEVVLTVKDAFGNTATQKAIVTLEEKEAPVLRVQDVRLPLDEKGTATLTETAAVIAKSDNCSTPVISFSRNMFSCAELGKPLAVTVTAKDASGNTTQKDITVTVSDATAPVVHARNIRVQLNENGEAVVAASDINNGSSDNCGVASLELDRTFFSCSDVGGNTVKLTATDGGGNTAMAVATVTVVDPYAPEIAPNQLFEIDENSPAGTVVATINAADNCSIQSWKITEGNKANAFMVSAGGVVSIQNTAALDYEANIEFVLKLSASDKAGNAATTSVKIRLKNMNDNAPVLAAPAEVSGNEEETISFTAQGSDADGNTRLQYQLSADAPAGASINSTTGLFSWTPAEDQDGVYTFNVILGDGLLTVEQTVTAVVHEVNQLPVITTPPPASAIVGEAYTYQLIATDADLPVNTLTYSAVETPSWLNFHAATQLLSGTPAIDSEGEHAVTLKVSDGIAAREQQFVIKVVRPTGIEDSADKDKIIIFPNPSAGSIMVVIEDLPAGSVVEARLLSLEGKTLLKIKGSLEQISQEVSAGLTDAEAGLYVLQLKRSKNVTSHRIVKK